MQVVSRIGYRVSRGLNPRIIGAQSNHSWASIPLAPPDKILGLNESFKSDANPKKVNLGVGAYRDGDGHPHVLPSVRTAEQRVNSKEMDHEYAGIAGVQEYIDASIEFAYGSDSLPLLEKRIAAIQTLSGTGACRIVGEFVKRFHGHGTKIFVPSPTWGNHINIFTHKNLTILLYCNCLFHSLKT